MTLVERKAVFVGFKNSKKVQGKSSFNFLFVSRIKSASNISKAKKISCLMKKFYDLDKQSTFKKKVLPSTLALFDCLQTSTLIYELWRSRKSHNIIYRLAIILETIQLCWYSIAPKFIHKASAMQWLEKTLHAIQVSHIFCALFSCNH